MAYLISCLLGTANSPGQKTETSFHTQYCNQMGSDHPPSKPRLIIASNRLPLSVKQKDDTFEVNPSSGGLVSALRGLKAADYVWLGWPGVEIDEDHRKAVDEELAKENAAAIYLDEKLAKDHYNGFSSK